MTSATYSKRWLLTFGDLLTLLLGFFIATITTMGLRIGGGGEIKPNNINMLQAPNGIVATSDGVPAVGTLLAESQGERVTFLKGEVLRLSSEELASEQVVSQRVAGIQSPTLQGREIVVKGCSSRRALLHENLTKVVHAAAKLGIREELIGVNPFPQCALGEENGSWISITVRE